MTPEEAAIEIAFIDQRAETEISGGITLENVRAYAEARPDFISSGAITHSAPAVDINCGIYPLRLGNAELKLRADLKSAVLINGDGIRFGSLLAMAYREVTHAGRPDTCSRSECRRSGRLWCRG